MGGTAGVRGGGDGLALALQDRSNERGRPQRECPPPRPAPAKLRTNLVSGEDVMRRWQHSLGHPGL